MGMDGFKWFQGVVEDRMDPLKLGRLRVRMVGLHPEKKSSIQGIRTEELLWCHPMQPITDAAMNGIGQTPLGVVEGTWVFGFFRDCQLMQDPVIIGTVGGIPEDAPVGSRGFNDPNEKYPKSDFLTEPDTNRLARNEKIDQTIVQAKRDTEEADIPTAGYNADGTSYNEPTTPYNASYPFNHVHESESGHVSEIDDTAGSERLHTYHRTGTFEEIHPDGSKVTKVVGDDYEIVVKDKKCYVKGNLNVTVIGDANVYVQGNVTQQVDGNYEQHIKGDVDQHVEGNVTQTVDLNVTETVHGNVTQQVDGNVTSTIDGDVNQTISGGTGLTQNVSSDVSITCTNFTVNASASHSTTASSISRSGSTISDDGGGATVNLAGAASIDGSAINLG
ncbi:baseplate hub subunit and tail lysozyme [Vibrio phage D479]